MSCKSTDVLLKHFHLGDGTGVSQEFDANFMMNPAVIVKLEDIYRRTMLSLEMCRVSPILTIVWSNKKTFGTES